MHGDSMGVGSLVYKLHCMETANFNEYPFLLLLCDIVWPLARAILRVMPMASQV